MERAALVFNAIEPFNEAVDKEARQAMIQSSLTEKSADFPTNVEIASTLEETADLLEAQDANPFRVGANRKAAETIRGLKGSVAHIVKAEAVEGLIRLPTIGRSLANSIDQIVRTRRLPLLERLRGEDAAEKSFATVPDIGPGLAFWGEFFHQSPP